MTKENRCPHGGPRKDNGNCTVPGPDGLAVQCVGEWAHEQKHGYLSRYIHASRAARAKFLRPGAHGIEGGAGFIDLFSGPGRVRVRETGSIEHGSPLLALAVSEAPFTRLVFADLDPENVAALRQRTAFAGDRVVVLQGDCNEIIEAIVAEVPGNGLNLALVDPFALDPLRFDTLAALAKVRRLDLVINFPTQDVKRNLKLRYAEKDNTVLDRALGTSSWRQRVHSPSDVHLLVDVLTEQLEGLGYTGARNRTIRVERNGVELYRLIFASKHPLADKLWEGIVRNTPSGQRGLPGF